MPIGLFFRAVRSAIWNGKFYYEEKDGYAEITLQEQGGAAKKAELRLYSLTDLEKLAIFQEARKDKYSEQLVSTWYTKRSARFLIKYASEQRMAFVLESDTIEYFSQLPFNLVPNLDYFDECRFIRVLKTQDLCLGQLRANYDISEEQIRILCDKVAGFNAFLRHGATVRDIVALELNALREHLDNYRHLSDALTLCSMEQIMGRSQRLVIVDLPSPSQSLATFKPAKDAVLPDESFSCSYSANTLTIKSLTNNNCFSVVFKYCNDEEKKTALDLRLQNCPEEKYINTWHVLRTINNDTNIVSSWFYCPEEFCLLKASCDAGFPEAEAAQLIGFFTRNMPYYKECEFARNLTTQYGTSLEKISQLPGMTLIKLKILCNHSRELATLLKKGLTFDDFAHMNEDWLNYVLTHWDEALAALHFINARELFGLGAQDLQCSSSASASSSCSDDDYYDTEEEDGYAVRI